jgi:hypothetical protein
MKKLLLLLLLLPFFAIAQVSNGREFEAEAIKTTGSQTITNPVYLVTEGVDGTHGKTTATSLEKTSNKSTFQTGDGTGSQYLTKDATAGAFNEFAESTLSTGAISNLSKVEMIATSTTNLKIRGTYAVEGVPDNYSPMYFASNLPTDGSFIIPNFLKSFDSFNYPLSQLETPTGNNEVSGVLVNTNKTYVKFLGLKFNGGIITGDTDFKGNKSVASLGYIVVVRTAGVITFKFSPSSESVVNQVLIAGNTSLARDNTALTTDVGISFSTTTTAFNSITGNLYGMSINWHTNNNTVNPNNGNSINTKAVIGVTNQPFSAATPTSFNSTSPALLNTTFDGDVSSTEAIAIKTAYFNTTTQLTTAATGNVFLLYRLMITQGGRWFWQIESAPNNGALSTSITDAKTKALTYVWDDAILPKGVWIKMGTLVISRNYTNFNPANSNDFAWFPSGAGSGGSSAVQVIGDATETVKGAVEFATPAETTAGTDNTRAVHPLGLKSALDAKIGAGTTNTVSKFSAGQLVDSSITDTGALVTVANPLDVNGVVRRKALIASTPYNSVANSEIVLGSRGAGVVPYIFGRCDGLFEGLDITSIKSGDTSNGGGFGDMSFRVGFTGGADALNPFATNLNQTAFSFNNGSTPLLSITRGGNSFFVGSITVPTLNDFLATSNTNFVSSASVNRLINTPTGNQWNDILAFNNRGYTMLFEKSTDNVTFTQSTIDMRLFAKKDVTLPAVLNYTTDKAVRWTFNNTLNSAYSWLKIKFPYQGAVTPNITVIVETSPDNITYTTRHTSTGAYSKEIKYFSIFDVDVYTRVKIVWNSGNTNVQLNGIELLSSRSGEQGPLSEYQVPYNWDENKNVIFGSNTTPLSAIRMHIAGSNSALSNIARGLYIGSTLVATSNDDFLVGLDITPTFTNGSFTGVTNLGLRVNGSAISSAWKTTGGTTSQFVDGTGALQLKSQFQTSLTNPVTSQASGALDTGAGYIPRLVNNTLIDDSNVYQDASGNVGIGTSSPIEKLHVVGSTNITSFYRVNSAIKINQLFGAGTAFGYGITPLDNVGIRNDSGAILMATGGLIADVRQIILPNGNVLIGTTTDNGVDKLQVNGTISASPATLSNQVVVKSQLDAVRPYKVYTALLSQTGTNAPTATVLENTLGGAVVWTRTSTGDYRGTLSGAFTIDKTAVFINGGNTPDKFVRSLSNSNTNTVSVYTINSSGVYFDSELVKTVVEVRVYP